ncbi:Cell death protease [Coemansia sp. RSA 2618]|nr:Cell death protease [Coemansia sp. RSA 2618]
MDRCTREFNRAPQSVHTDVCESIAGVFLDDGGPEPGMCYNQYDLRLTDTHPACGMNWPPEVGVFTDYLNRRDVQAAVNVHNAPARWAECNNAVNRLLHKDRSPPSASLLPGILQHIPVLFFVGAEDYLCNYVGTEWTIGNLTWAGATGFSPARRRDEWSIDNAIVGSVESDRGLTYALVHNASHMVGVDRPREMLDLFTLFTNASADNLRFRSSFRAADISQPLPPHSHRWLGAGIAIAVLFVFAMGFVCRARLFAWWLKRRPQGYDSVGRSDDDTLVASRQTLDDNDDSLDDAFVMSDFSFKPVLRRSIDHSSLLLDDSMASSPDDDLGPISRSS